VVNGCEIVHSARGPQRNHLSKANFSNYQLRRFGVGGVEYYNSLMSAVMRFFKRNWTYRETSSSSFSVVALAVYSALMNNRCLQQNICTDFTAIREHLAHAARFRRGKLRYTSEKYNHVFSLLDC